jgi:transmembrane sensor
MTPQRFDQLWQQFNAGQLSEPEYAELLEAVDTGAFDDRVQANILAALNARRTDSRWTAEREAAVWGRISPHMPKQEPARRFRIGWRWAAAAILVASFGTVAWFVLFNKPQKEIFALEPQAQRFKNDIAPGTKKATLILANGSTIVLDSAKKGSLATQGNATVSKMDDGRLMYSAGKEEPTAILYNTLTVPRGGQIVQLTLADGTKVWMNAASSLRYPTGFRGKDRTVVLTGEGYFEVAKNPAMPFHVQVNGTDVEVLGTHFNVMAYEEENETKTTLLEGSVKVTVTRGSASLQLAPGQQAKINKAGEIELFKGVDIESTMAWKNGLFQFSDENIENIMRQVSRWYDVDVSYEGNVKALKFGAEISRKENVSKLLKFLELTGVIHFKIDGNKILVTP